MRCLEQHGHTPQLPLCSAVLGVVEEPQMCKWLALTLLNCRVPCQPLNLFACLLAWMICSHLANCYFFVLCLGSL